MFVNIIILCVAAVALWFVLPFVWRLIQERRLGRLCQKNRAIVLTYDDGPSAGLSRDLVDLLNRHKVQATFFMLGRNAVAAPEIVAHINAGGHEIGSHSQQHYNAWKAAPWAVWRDIAAGRATLTGFGARADLFRPPFGKITLAGLLQAGLSGLGFAFWTVDSRDSWDRRPIDDVLAELTEKGGGVLLMHDTDRAARGPAPDQHHQYVLDLTTRVIEFAAGNNFTLMPLGALEQKGASL